MALTVGAAPTPANRGPTLELAPRRPALTLRKPGGQGGLELRAGRHAELAVGGGEVRLDGLDAEEQLARDRAGAAARRGQRADLALARRQGAGALRGGAPGPQPGGHELATGALGQGRRARGVGGGQRGPQRLARAGARARASFGA